MNILIESNCVMFNRRIHVSKYTVSNIISKQFNNKLVMLKKCVLLTGGLEVSFSIEKIFFHKPDEYVSTTMSKTSTKIHRSAVQVNDIGHNYHF